MLPCRRDNYRPFFEQTFPLLLRRVFGYDGASWLTTLAHGGKEADISALLDLLSPTGVAPYVAGGWHVHLHALLQPASLSASLHAIVNFAV